MLNNKPKPLILYIEPSAPCARLMEKIIIHVPNFNYIHSPGLEESTRIIKKQKPDIILTEIKFHDITTADYITTLNNINNYKKPRLIGVSAEVFPDSIKYALDNGFEAYITKPIDIRTLLNHLLII